MEMNVRENIFCRAKYMRIFCDSVISSDGDLLVFSSEENSRKLYVDIIDSNNGKPKSMIELNDISCYNICGSYEKYDFIYSDIDGVYGYIIDKETSEIIIKSDDADMTNFRRPPYQVIMAEKLKKLKEERKKKQVKQLI